MNQREGERGNKGESIFIAQLATDAKFFHRAFVNPCMMENQRRSKGGSAFANPCMIENQRRSKGGFRLAAHLAIESLMANYCSV